MEIIAQNMYRTFKANGNWICFALMWANSDGFNSPAMFSISEWAVPSDLLELLLIRFDRRSLAQVYPSAIVHDLMLHLAVA